MKIACGATIAASVLFVCANSQAAPQPRITDYCLVAPLDAGSDGVTRFHLGDFVMKARLTVRGSHYDLTAWNTMPDNPQILMIDADGTYRPTGPTPFRFIDNFDNHGRGSFRVRGPLLRIEIERVQTAPGGENIGRNYGPYTLSRRGCKWEEP